MLSCTKKPKRAKNLKIGEPKIILPKEAIKTFVPDVTKDGVVLTARSLLLNQEVSCFAARGYSVPWLRGSLVENLGLSPKDLKAFEGKTVLDLAGGASFAAEELAVAFLAKQVIVVDLFHDKYQDRMGEAYALTCTCKKKKTCECKSNRKAAGEVYVENLKGLGKHIPSVKNGWEEVHKTLVDNSKGIAKAYFKKSPAVCRMKGDATDMQAVETSSVDVVLNSWMLMYMSPNNRKRAIKEMVRVTKPGGRIRIVGGEMDADGAYSSSKKGETAQKALKEDDKYAFSAKKFSKWFPGFDNPTKNEHFGGKHVEINTALSKKVPNKGSLVVLDVKKAKKNKATM